MDHTTVVTVLVSLLGLSEALGGIKAVGANSIYQVVIRIIKILMEIVKPSAPAVVTN